MNLIDLKLQKLALKSSQLEEEMKSLALKRNQQLLKSLEKLPIHSVDTYTLIGGIIDVINRSQNDAQQKEEWHQLGASFLKKKTSKAPQPAQTKAKT